MGKSTVAPKKALTFPSLELQVATRAVKFADVIKTELDYQNLTHYFLTNSKTVLGYINNVSKRFHVFVCNRAKRIRDSTEPTDWRIVSNVVISITACQKTKLTDSFPQGKLVFNTILKLVQQNYFANWLLLLKENGKLSKSTTLSSLVPFLDECGDIRVGGHLIDYLSCYEVWHPAILPGESQVTKAFAYFKHVEAAHQERATTANVLRAAGVYLVGRGTKMLATMIRRWVKCTKLLGNLVRQKMANSPQC
ncbi:uncharacterized protein [Watersipora subatra]|uniref:uncharacterized protein n=1 Tax=Watersipora subatra TaxID=2589382 RepID=UPI00355B141C